MWSDQRRVDSKLEISLQGMENNPGVKNGKIMLGGIGNPCLWGVQRKSKVAYRNAKKQVEPKIKGQNLKSVCIWVNQGKKEGRIINEPLE